MRDHFREETETGRLRLLQRGAILPVQRAAGPKVLVLDGEERASLAVARSLVAAGYSVVVAARQGISLAGASRGVRTVRLLADPLRESATYAREVADASELEGAELLIPVTDASAEAILEHRHLLRQSTAVPFASLETYRAASDKVRVHELACELGIGVDDSVVVTRQGDAAPLDQRFYPGVVKPHRSLVGGGQRIKAGVRLVADRAACELALRSLPAEAFPVLVQRRIRGPGEGIFIARWNGRTVARFAHRRLREKPPSGGVSVLRESILLDPGLQRACESLLDRLDWNGVAMIEGKRDVERGGWAVMEINGRFWGSLQLAIDAGVDFPAIIARTVLGAPLQAPPEWRAGVRLRWEWGDIDHLLVRMLKSKTMLSLPPEAPGRLAAIAAFFAHRPGRDHMEVFRFRDPMPFIVETLRRMGFER